MGKRANIVKGRAGRAVCAAAAFALLVPSAVVALPSLTQDGEIANFGIFTPANVDPELAQRVSANIRSKGLAARFTPVGTEENRTVTVAVRVDEGTARAISVRNATAAATGPAGQRSSTLAATQYNLGIARGYQNFAKAPALPDNVRRIDMPDLSAFEPGRGSEADKPSRFQPRISLEQSESIGRSPRTLDSRGEQSFDLGGAYRITRNLDVTAGVRLSQENDRLAPLTDNVQDSQAVYVGTQFRF